MTRACRKNEHIFSRMQAVFTAADFRDISFIHNSLSGLDLARISLETEYLGRTYSSPLYFNAITGGTELAMRINAALAEVARECDIPMAVGSQMAALENNAGRKAVRSFTIARAVNRHGTIWSNLGSYSSPDLAERAIEMIDADAIQLHLNIPQELSMQDGDTDFSGMVERISAVARSVHVPVIAKEVGFGISAENAETLVEAGVMAIDVGGKGGTNFIALEHSRRIDRKDLLFQDWGIPTAISIIEVAETLPDRVDLFASGGTQHPLDMAKALALGAKAVGLAGYPLYLLMKKGRCHLTGRIKEINNEIKKIMLMVGASSLADLRRTRLVITGRTAEWMIRRGFNPDHYAVR